MTKYRKIELRNKKRKHLIFLDKLANIFSSGTYK